LDFSIAEDNTILDTSGATGSSMSLMAMGFLAVAGVAVLF
jgi:hypothetical protein